MGTNVERVDTVAGLPPRPRDAHKGDFGRVLIVGGSQGMIGAVALAANAAMRGGAGLVTFAAAASIQPHIATLCPCATSIPLACGGAGDLGPKALRQVSQAAGNADVIAVGPGMSAGAVQQNIVQSLLEQDKPVVIDADGLNNLAALADWPRMRRCPLVLTPHPGEFSRLTDRPTADIQADRQGAALAAMAKWLAAADAQAGPLVCVLKGAGTVATDGRRLYVNDTGNPGMATGGSGDVLTGLTAAVIAQGLGPFEAACLAVRLHGRAGDLAAEQLGEPAVMATDLLDFLPQAMKEA